MAAKVTSNLMVEVVVSASILRNIVNVSYRGWRKSPVDIFYAA